MNKKTKVPKSFRKIVKRGKLDTARHKNTWLGTGTVMKGGGVKYIYILGQYIFNIDMY
jgi:hypothetical protein